MKKIYSYSNREKLNKFQRKLLEFNCSHSYNKKKSYLIERIELLNILMKYSKNDVFFIGLVGYPNVGKSSIINVIANKKVNTITYTSGKIIIF